MEGHQSETLTFFLSPPVLHNLQNMCNLFLYFLILSGSGVWDGIPFLHNSAVEAQSITWTGLAGVGSFPLHFPSQGKSYSQQSLVLSARSSAVAEL